jgi:hypothetical protein
MEWKVSRESLIAMGWLPTGQTIRNCPTETAPRVEKKDLLKARQLDCLSRVECSSPGRLGCGLYRRDHPSKGGGYLFQRTTGLLGPDCRDHQVERLGMYS